MPSLKDKVLKCLKDSDGVFISGEQLSQLIGVTRTAVWKSIKALREDGYKIEAHSNKGYMIESTPDIINATEIKYGLDNEIIGKSIYCFDTIDSTSSYAKKIAAEGCADGTVVITETQTAGRGRLGREWESGHGTGIWMSIVLRPKIPPEMIQIITIGASVAVANAIKTVTGVSVGIKWPNDIILDNKKVCGILTEMNCEMEAVNYLVVGIGMNIHQEQDQFPPELVDKAISLKGYFKTNKKPLPNLYRNDIIKTILLEMEKVYKSINQWQSEDILQQWRKYSVTLGRHVKIVEREQTLTATAIDITKEGRLLIKLSDGVRREIVSGEISVRGLLGYV